MMNNKNKETIWVGVFQRLEKGQNLLATQNLTNPKRLVNMVTIVSCFFTTTYGSFNNPTFKSSQLAPFAPKFQPQFQITTI